MAANGDGDGDAIGGTHPAVFLDRDGVINERRWLLVRRWEGFRFRPGVLDALKRLAEADVRIVVVTNQGAVGWGWIEESELDRIHRNMVEEITAAGGRVDLVKACTCRGRGDCACKKPQPGMLLEAAEELDLALDERSWMVGDKGSDMRAARAAGVRPILVNPPLRTRIKREQHLADHVLPGLPQAVELILERIGKE